MNAKAYENAEPEVIDFKRNPYLVNYTQQKAARERRAQRYGEQQKRADNRKQSERIRQLQNDPLYPGDEARRLNSYDLPRRRRTAVDRQRAAARRRRIVRRQRLAVCGGVFCIVLFCGLLLIKRGDAKAAESGTASQQAIADVASRIDLPRAVQGIPAEDYAGHPDWEEDFLTLNEYSRPGDALEGVNSIFVHYTANPKTSAAQNRSYFEQLKDNHERSASAHFIIGYDGEIIQCIPLDEIAYAVQTRNFDSISIECCYKSADGSFTQETYDSLIDLLAWLTDVYDLSTDDILRHYDCGGKKCPIYYTEHEDAWEKLKSDVAAQRNI